MRKAWSERQRDGYTCVGTHLIELDAAGRKSDRALTTHTHSEQAGSQRNRQIIVFLHFQP